MKNLIIITLLSLFALSCHRKEEDPQPKYEALSLTSERQASTDDTIYFHLTTTRVPMRFISSQGTTYGTEEAIYSKDTIIKHLWTPSLIGATFEWTEMPTAQWLISDTLKIVATCKGKTAFISKNAQLNRGYYSTWK